MLTRLSGMSLMSFICAALLLLAPLSAIAKVRSEAAYGSSVDQKDKDQKDKDQKDKKDDESDKKEEKLSKSERRYQQVKQFSQELYGKDQEFHDEVDEAFRQKQREHVNYAYFINTRDSGDEQVTRTGDKLKVEDTMYDNPVVQDYVNRIGQSLVPKSTTSLYAFKVTLNPIPEARSLSTGTVYISSGLLSMIDNEAQLAYVLGHEVAHIEKEHWREDALVAHGIERYNEKQQKKRSIIGAVASVATAGIAGGVAGSLNSALMTGAVAMLTVPVILKFVIPNATFTWDKIQEDEADHLALRYMLERNYDPREVPKLYADFQNALKGDPRVGLGFIASRDRVSERKLALAALSDGSKRISIAGNAAAKAEKAEGVINGELAGLINAKLDAGGLIGTSADFGSVMAELKRDNGIRAFYYDMFLMARGNLEESLNIRSNDPQAHLYYGKVLKLTAHNPAEKSRALAEFVRAIELDRRRVLPEARLHRALAMMDAKDSAQTTDIVANLKEYVELYQREHGGVLPPNMDVIYDYMQESGEMMWSASPVINIKGDPAAAGARKP